MSRRYLDLSVAASRQMEEREEGVLHDAALLGFEGFESELHEATAKEEKQTRASLPREVLEAAHHVSGHDRVCDAPIVEGEQGLSEVLL